tara:strand:+ start:1072 stop:1254 length:183 start_codon:yes stop_codon:yes gene_type:complete
MVETINNIKETIENIDKKKKSKIDESKIDESKIDKSKENKKIQILLEKEKYRYEECHGGC